MSNQGQSADAERNSEQFYNTFADLQKEGLLPIIYSPKYNISFFGLEKLHPFDSCKYMNVVHDLEKSKLVSKKNFITPQRMPTDDELKLVHTEEYLASLKSSYNVAVITEVPVCAIMPNFMVRSRVLNPMLYATSGTIVAAKVALEQGWCINLSGGYHHACGYRGGGFCVYSDITLSLRHLRKLRPDVTKVMIIDLDAHQGNGHERDKIEANDTELFIVDIFNSAIYPHDSFALQAIDVSVPIRPGTGDSKYLGHVASALEEAFTRFRPDIVYYNAGTDILQGDTLGMLDVSPKGVIQRDAMVFQAAKSRGIPLVMVLSGGYQKSNAKVISSSIQNIIQTVL